jgi:hypothetical protein
MKSRGVTGLVAVAGFSIVFLVISCISTPGLNDGDSLGATTGTGSVRLLVTDKPYPYDCIAEALVTITRVEIRRANTDDGADAAGEGDEPLEEVEPAGTPESDAGDDSAADDEAADESDDGDDEGDEGRPFIEIYSDEVGKTFNLLELQKGQVDLLADATVPAGTYDQMRIIVTGGELRLKDGREFPLPLRVPSGEQTGIKLHFQFEVEAERETVLLLDIDLSRAFSPIPGGRIDEPEQIRSFRFSPSLAMRLIRLADAGSVGGTVCDPAGTPLADASVTVYQGDVEIGNTATAADGTYRLSGLPGGAYRLTVAAQGFEDHELENVLVQAGEKTDVVRLVMQASPGDADGE